MKIKFCCKSPNLKVTKKLAIILSTIVALILTAGIVICAVFGFNSSIKSEKTLVVNVDTTSYLADGDDMMDTAKGIFKDYKISAEESSENTKGDFTHDIVYVFDNDTSMKKLNTVRVELSKELTAEYPEAIISVAIEEIETFGTVAKNYVGRGLIALAIFAVVSLLYAWFRYKFHAALYLLCGNLLSLGLTTGLVAMFRIPVTPSVAAVVAASVLFSTVTILMFFNKLRAAQKEESAAEKSAEELVSSSIAWKETTLFAGMLIPALLIVLCVGRALVAWFSLAAIVAVCVAAFIGLVYVPVMFPPAKRCADKWAAKKASNYKGAKKGEKAKKSNDEEIVD